MRKLIAAVVGVSCLVAACGGSDDGGEPAEDAGGSTGSPDTPESSADEAASSDASAGDDDGNGGGGEVPAGLPTECVEAPTEFEFTMTGSETYTGTLAVASAAAKATPIVPNGDGSLDDLSIEEMNQLGAESPLLLYTQFVGDHEFTADDIGFLTGPEPPTGSITLGLTVVPTSPDGLSTGDVVASTDEVDYDAFTTFGTVGVFFQPADDVETYFLVNNLDETQGGTAEVLYVDDAWLCVAWQLAGETREPEGTYSVSGTLLTPFERGTIPFN